MHDHAGNAGAGLIALTGMWFAMMIAMMAPVAWPWVVAFQRFGSKDGRDHVPGRSAAASTLSTLSFAGGYAAAWGAYSVAAAGLQGALTAMGLLDPRHRWSSIAAAAILAGAGAYQFAPLKRACLAHCRSPLTYFLMRWRNGPTAGFRLGFGHGIFCVGCCWALMATALVVGMSSLWWMLALTAVAFVEQVMPLGAQVRFALGITLLAAAALQLL